jgi:septum formation protein
MINKKIVLASGSPRRQSLLRQIGIDFDVKESGVEEVFDHTKKPEENVVLLSRRKAETVAASYDNAIIIGADTIVVLDKDILGKPLNEQEAVSMLQRLSGRTHVVYTGFTLVDRPSNCSTMAFEATKVTFRKLSDDEITEYVRSGAPMDKAGAYGIQDDYGAVFVEKVDGCFYNVVGLPLTRFYMTLLRFQQQLQIT